jgi:ABC-type branched-subunit amino acid transport system permease subunit
VTPCEFVRNDTRALFIGLPVRTYRRAAFVRSGLFTGLAGALYGELTRQITPNGSIGSCPLSWS